MAVVKKIAALLGVALVASQGCKSHSSATSCGNPYLTSVSYVGYGGYGWGGYIVDPYYDGYGYGYGGTGWFDPGDDYDPSAPEPSGGWDDDDGAYFPGADDPGSDIGDPSGGYSGDTDPGGDTSGGGVDTGDTASYRVRIASDSSGNASEQKDANGCYRCLVGCRIGAGDTGRQAVGGSSYDYTSACRVAVHRLERWAHSEQSSRIVDCQVLIPAPISGADGGTDGRVSAEASIGPEEDATVTTPDAGADAADAADAQP